MSTRIDLRIDEARMSVPDPEPPMPILKREPDCYPDNPFTLEAPWRVAHLRSRQEKVFVRYLRQYDIPFYLPQIEKTVQRSGRNITSYLPVFPGYAFFRGGPHESS